MAAARSTHRQPLPGDHSRLRFSSSHRAHAGLFDFSQGHQLDAQAVAELAGDRDRFVREPGVGMLDGRQSPTLGAALQEDAGPGGVRDQTVAAWHGIGTPERPALPRLVGPPRPSRPLRAGRFHGRLMRLSTALFGLLDGGMQELDRMAERWYGKCAKKK